MNKLKFIITALSFLIINYNVKINCNDSADDIDLNMALSICRAGQSVDIPRIIARFDNLIFGKILALARNKSEIERRRNDTEKMHTLSGANLVIPLLATRGSATFGFANKSYSEAVLNSSILMCANETASEFCSLFSNIQDDIKGSKYLELMRKRKSIDALYPDIEKYEDAATYASRIASVINKDFNTLRDYKAQSLYAQQVVGRAIRSGVEQMSPAFLRTMVEHLRIPKEFINKFILENFFWYDHLQELKKTAIDTTEDKSAVSEIFANIERQLKLLAGIDPNKKIRVRTLRLERKTPLIDEYTNTQNTEDRVSILEEIITGYGYGTCKSKNTGSFELYSNSSDLANKLIKEAEEVYKYDPFKEQRVIDCLKKYLEEGIERMDPVFVAEICKKLNKHESADQLLNLSREHRKNRLAQARSTREFELIHLIYDRINLYISGL